MVAAAAAAALAVAGVLTACGGSSSDASGSTDGGGANDATTGDEVAAQDGNGGGDDAADATGDAHCTYVDDADVTHGCAPGSQGPGDRDDGGGSVAPPPDAALDATNLPFAASCWNNAQCASGVCYLYKVRGTFCTAVCGSDVDCPDASLGCNGQGVCRIGP